MGIEQKIENLLDKSKTAQDQEIQEVTEVSIEESLTVDVTEDVAALVEGEDLTEEFKAKAATIFESAVVSRVKQEIVKLDEKYEVKLQEAVDQHKSGLIEQVDGYLSYIADEWMIQNEIALERGMKSEILEGFVNGLKGLFEEHYIDVPDEKLDVLGTLETENAKLESKLNESITANIELKKTLVESQRKDIVINLSEGLADTDKEKLVALSEELSFDSAEAFTTKVQTIRESYFTGKPATKPAVKSVVSDTPVDQLDETYVDPAIRQFAAQMSTLNK